MHRRQLISGLISLIAAPAIVRASSLMPIKAYNFGPPYLFPVNATLLDDLSQQIVTTLIYGSDESPMQFTGLRML